MRADAKIVVSRSTWLSSGSPSVPQTDSTDPVPAVRRWLEDVVIGLGLCPFAAPPWQRNSVRLVVSKTTDEAGLLSQLHDEMLRLDDSDASALETTLLIVPTLFATFDDFNQFLDPAEALLERFGWVGRYQLASFHPDYRFADVADDDLGNLTNRAPYPILHLIREDSIERALEHYPDPDGIPIRNIARIQALDAAELSRLFPYLFGNSCEALNAATTGRLHSP